MDPVSLIVSALITAVANLAEPAVKDAYEGLKTLIKNKFAGNAKIEGALDGIHDDPETWQKPLEKTLKETDINQDTKIITAAQTLTDLLERLDKQAGLNISVSGNSIEGGSDNTQVNIGQMTGGKVSGSEKNIYYGKRDDK